MTILEKEIESLLLTIATHARLGDYGDASRDLNRCLLLIERARPALLRAPKLDLDKLNYSLETVFLMLKNKDWVAIADIIEFELIGLWRALSSDANS